MIYGGITIGPILDVLTSAKKERELWFGSYLFSWMMEKFYGELNILKYDVIIPSFKNAVEYDKSIGLYPDRLVFNNAGNIKTADVYADIERIYDQFIEILCNIYNEVVNLPNTVKVGNQNETKDIIKDYLQVKWLVTEREITISEMFTMLENAELSTLADYLISEKPCDRCRTLPSTLQITDDKEKRYEKKLYLCPVCAIKYGAQYVKTACLHTGLTEENHFPSVIDIGAAEIKEKLRVCKDDEAKLKLIQNDSPYLSYFCVLCLDVDNTSLHLKGLQEKPEKINEFSGQLFAFCQNVIQLIDGFGGRTIYAGGDDVLALIPVRNMKSSNKAMTMLDLVGELNSAFRQIFPVSEKSKLSISIGISMQYVKYPLRGSLLSALDCLFTKAKKHKSTLNIIIRKHAGSSFEYSVNLDNLVSVNRIFTSQINGSFLPEGIYDSIATISSLIATTSDVGIESLIQNHFNESNHDKARAYFNELICLIQTELNDFTDVTSRNAKLENIVNLFRLARLLKAKGIQ